MTFKTTELFDKQSKKLGKKYKNLKGDLNSFICNFDSLHQQSIIIQKNVYKVRVANSNKNKGKSNGYRIYYYVKIEEATYLLTIYDKSSVEMIDESLLIEIIEGLE